MTNIGDTGFCLPIISQKRSYSGELFPRCREIPILGLAFYDGLGGGTNGVIKPIWRARAIASARLLTPRRT